jgi:hypothetical protein
MSKIESLRQRTRRAIADHDLNDPQAVADRVLEEIPDDQLRACLAEALPLFARQMLMENRPSAHNLPHIPATPAPAPAPLSPVPAMTAPSPVFQTPGQAPPSVTPAQRHATPQGGRARGFHGGAHYREAWQRVLDSNVKGVDGEDKKLRHCSPEDLDAIAYRIQQQADAAASRARGYREIARVMREHNAHTVDALPVEVKMDLLGRQA